MRHSITEQGPVATWSARAAFNPCLLDYSTASVVSSAADRSLLSLFGLLSGLAFDASLLAVEAPPCIRGDQISSPLSRLSVMPKMNGQQVANSVKPLHPEMEILFMSGYTDDAIVHHGVLEPGTNFLEKPFTADGLISTVREILNKTEDIKAETQHLAVV